MEREIQGEKKIKNLYIYKGGVGVRWREKYREKRR